MTNYEDELTALAVESLMRDARNFTKLKEFDLRCQQQKPTPTPNKIFLKNLLQTNESHNRRVNNKRSLTLIIKDNPTDSSSSKEDDSSELESDEKNSNQSKRKRISKKRKMNSKFIDNRATSGNSSSSSSQYDSKKKTLKPRFESNDRKP